MATVVLSFGLSLSLNYLTLLALDVRSSFIQEAELATGIQTKLVSSLEETATKQSETTVLLQSKDEEDVSSLLFTSSCSSREGQNENLELLGLGISFGILLSIFACLGFRLGLAWRAKCLRRRVVIRSSRLSSAAVVAAIPIMEQPKPSPPQEIAEAQVRDTLRAKQDILEIIHQKISAIQGNGDNLIKALEKLDESREVLSAHSANMDLLNEARTLAEITRGVYQLVSSLEGMNPECFCKLLERLRNESTPWTKDLETVRTHLLGELLLQKSKKLIKGRRFEEAFSILTDPVELECLVDDEQKERAKKVLVKCKKHLDRKIQAKILRGEAVEIFGVWLKSQEKSLKLIKSALEKTIEAYQLYRDERDAALLKEWGKALLLAISSRQIPDNDEEELMPHELAIEILSFAQHVASHSTTGEAISDLNDLLDKAERKKLEFEAHQAAVNHVLANQENGMQAILNFSGLQHHHHQQQLGNNKEALRELLLLLHPDKNRAQGAKQAFQILQELLASN